MLTVRTKVKQSPVHGLGLFADEDISKGTQVWKISPLLDVTITEEEFEELSKYEKDFINYYGFFSKKSNKYHLSFDNVRYINHSEDGNVSIDNSVDGLEYPLVATKDIQKGEEILQNYYEFDDDHVF